MVNILIVTIEITRNQKMREENLTRYCIKKTIIQHHIQTYLNINHIVKLGNTFTANNSFSRQRVQIHYLYSYSTKRNIILFSLSSNEAHSSRLSALQNPKLCTIQSQRSSSKHSTSMNISEFYAIWKRVYNLETSLVGITKSEYAPSSGRNALPSVHEIVV